jgi:transposase
MGQRARILTEILGFDGWKVKETFFESADGRRIEPLGGFAVLRETRLVLVVERRWLARCSHCGAACRRVHERLARRRWADLPWAGHPVDIEYGPCRLKCRGCGGHAVEMVAWADPYQRQSRRLQHHLAVEAASMPVMHVAALHGLSWLTVRRAEERAIERWEATRPAVPLRHVGVDEKWLGRRHGLEHKFVTVVSNLETGEPVWIGKGRSEKTLRRWLESLPREQKAEIKLFAMDLHRPFWNAVDNTRGLEHAAIVHDPFHVMKLAGAMLDELRRDVFFRAGPELRAIGKGRRWLLLRAWERVSDRDRVSLRQLLAHNRTLARGYQIKEELRDVLDAPDGAAMKVGLARILRRTQSFEPRALRRLHDTLNERWNEILALAEHRPATGRIEALNNNWETLVRRARGYRDHNYLLRKLRFMVANPIRTNDGVKRFLALGLTPPMPRRQAA